MFLIPWSFESLSENLPRVRTGNEGGRQRRVDDSVWGPARHPGGRGTERGHGRGSPPDGARHGGRAGPLSGAPRGLGPRRGSRSAGVSGARVGGRKSTSWLRPRPRLPISSAPILPQPSRGPAPIIPLPHHLSSPIAPLSPPVPFALSSARCSLLSQSLFSLLSGLPASALHSALHSFVAPASGSCRLVWHCIFIFGFWAPAPWNLLECVFNVEGFAILALPALGSRLLP